MSTALPKIHPFPQAPEAMPGDVTRLKLVEACNLNDAAAYWESRARTAEAKLHKLQQRNIRRELLDGVTIREITTASAQWVTQPATRLRLIERVVLFFMEGRA